MRRLKQYFVDQLYVDEVLVERAHWLSYYCEQIVRRQRGVTNGREDVAEVEQDITAAQQLVSSYKRDFFGLLDAAADMNFSVMASHNDYLIPSGQHCKEEIAKLRMQIRNELSTVHSQKE